MAPCIQDRFQARQGPSGSVVPLAAFLPRSRVNGPGVRTVIWVQGCPLRCPGCFNPAFQPFTGGTPTLVDGLTARILGEPGIEGVTFSGGEPFAHAGVLGTLAAGVRAAGLSVVVFTGCTRAELLSGPPDWRALLAASDALIAGPYRRDQPSVDGYLSSANQELVLLTGRYTPADFACHSRRMEFRIAPGGTVAVTGLPGGWVGLGAVCRASLPEHTDGVAVAPRAVERGKMAPAPGGGEAAAPSTS